MATDLSVPAFLLFEYFDVFEYKTFTQETKTTTSSP